VYDLHENEHVDRVLRKSRVERLVVQQRESLDRNRNGPSSFL
jgi:hypothetical protein